MGWNSFFFFFFFPFFLTLSFRLPSVELTRCTRPGEESRARRGVGDDWARCRVQTRLQQASTASNKIRSERVAGHWWHEWVGEPGTEWRGRTGLDAPRSLCDGRVDGRVEGSRGRGAGRVWLTPQTLCDKLVALPWISITLSVPQSVNFRLRVGCCHEPGQMDQQRNLERRFAARSVDGMDMPARCREKVQGGTCTVCTCNLPAQVLWPQRHMQPVSGEIVSRLDASLGSHTASTFMHIAARPGPWSAGQGGVGDSDGSSKQQPLGGPGSCRQCRI